MRRILQIQRCLEQRTVAEAARGLQRFDHLFERQVLVRVRAQRRRLDLCQQLGHARVRIQLHAQRQRVDEEADH
ncbi:hypothetical protein QSH18_21795, partial [Xanthomonas sp. NCPPB 2654]|uniref:hypothetical protein n=1 Tax=Xanthomonas sp. NCPPB 2654 TaxID=487541 RepID=UPI00256F130F